MRIALNALGYQAVWLIAVLGAARGAPGWGIAAAAAFVALQWWVSAHKAGDAILVAAALALGMVLDGLLGQSGWLRYASAQPALVAPAWILAIWAAFALTLNHSLRFLQGRPAWGALLGAVGGPLAYWSAGRGFDAVAFGGPPLQALGVLALAWALALPLLSELAQAWRSALADVPAGELP